MEFDWDDNKRKLNINKHGVDFVAARELWFSPMIVKEDDREDYGERRWIGMGRLGERVMVVAFTKRERNVIRIISCRKANHREVSYYEQAISASR